MATAFRMNREAVEQIEQLVASGSFTTPEAVLEEGVRLVRELDEWYRMVKTKADAGQADFEAGRVRDLDEVFDELEARYRNWQK